MIPYNSLLRMLIVKYPVMLQEKGVTACTQKNSLHAEFRKKMQKGCK